MGINGSFLSSGNRFEGKSANGTLWLHLKYGSMGSQYSQPIRDSISCISTRREIALQFTGFDVTSERGLYKSFPFKRLVECTFWTWERKGLSLCSDRRITLHVTFPISLTISANQETASLGDFTKPRLRRPLVLGLLLMFFQQFTGINAFMFYCATIFHKAGFGEGSTTISILVAGVQFLVTLFALSIVDRAGRRVLLLASGVGMLVCCVTVGAYFYAVSKSIDVPTWAAVAGVSLYIVSFALGWGPCAWLMIGELFPAKARGKGCAACVCFNWGCAFVVTKTFPLLLDHFTEAGAFWFYGGTALLSVIFVYFFLPETKGRSLEDIEAWFNTRRWSRVAPMSEAPAQCTS